MKALLKEMSFVLIAMILLSCRDRNEEVHIPDENPDLQTFIEIPDSGLKAALLKEVDTNNDGNISQDEVSKTLYFSQFRINASGKNIKDLTGIEHFTNITQLDLSNNQLTNIDKLKALTKLKELNLMGNNLSGTLDLSSLQNLSEPDIVKAPNNTRVIAVRVASFQKANDFNIKEATNKYTTGGPVQTINFTDATFKSWVLSQTSIDRDGNREITTEEARAYTGEMLLGATEVASLDDLKYFENIKKITINSTILTTLNLSGLTKLETIQVSSALTSVSLSNLPSLRSLDLRNNKFSELTLAGLPALTSLNLANNRALLQLNISALTALQELNLFDIGISGVLDLRALQNLNPKKVNILGGSKNPSITAVQVATGTLASSLNDEEKTYLYTSDTNVDTSKVVITDEQLRITIATKLGNRSKTAFTKTELAAIETLDLIRDIQNISGLEHLTGLRELKMSVKIVGYTLPNLPKLTKLSIGGTTTTSVDLSNITTLTDFGITAPNIINVDLTRNHNLQRIEIGSSSNAMPRLQCVKVLQSQVTPLRNGITGFEADAKKEKIKSVCN